MTVLQWQPVGIAVLSATSAEVVLGTFSATLTDGYLPVLVGTMFPEDPTPLGFGVVGVIDNTGIRSVPSGRYYPNRQPEVLALGPATLASVTGEITFKPRSYNRRWLEHGIPAPTWAVRAMVASAEPQPTPRFTPGGFLLNDQPAAPMGSNNPTTTPAPLRARA